MPFVRFGSRRPDVMTGRWLLQQWLAGAVFAALILRGPPAWTRPIGDWFAPGIEGTRDRLAGLRRDSVEAVRAAPLELTSRGDSVRAVVFVPPDPGGLLAAGGRRLRTINVLVLAVIALVLGWNTVLWWRARKEIHGSAVQAKRPEVAK